MAGSAGLPPASPPFWWRGLLLALLVAGAVWLAGLLPRPWGAYDRELLHRLREPALASAVLLAAPWLALVAVRARSRHPLRAAVGAEEPLLVAPSVVSCQSGTPVVALAGLEPGAGVSTLTFNLAVSLALQGEAGAEDGPRAPRPVCLLAEGPLTEALGLSPQVLEEHLQPGPFRVGAGVVNLAVRHASVCELLCLAPKGRTTAVLGLLVRELRRHYDAVLVDGVLGERVVVDIALEAADALLLVGLATAASLGPPASGSSASGRWGSNRRLRCF